MRKFVLKMSISVDGFVAGPNGEKDWIFRTASPDSTEWVVDTCRNAGVHAMGSRTYYDMAAYWPYSDSPFTSPMNDIPKVVFSRSGVTDGTQAERTTRAGATPTAAVLQSWAQPIVACGDLAEEVARLKQEPGNYILAHGGALLAGSLIAAGLIDEDRLVIHPVALGKGLQLFSALRSPVDLRLIDSNTFSSGVVAAVYQPA